MAGTSKTPRHSEVGAWDAAIPESGSLHVRPVSMLGDLTISADYSSNQSVPWNHLASANEIPTKGRPVDLASGGHDQYITKRQCADRPSAFDADRLPQNTYGSWLVVQGDSSDEEIPSTRPEPESMGAPSVGLSGDSGYDGGDEQELSEDDSLRAKSEQKSEVFRGCHARQ